MARDIAMPRAIYASALGALRVVQFVSDMDHSDVVRSTGERTDCDKVGCGQ